MESLFSILTAFGLSASAGLNAYIPLLVVSLLARYTDLVTLKSPWDVLESPWIIGLLVILVSIEFFADKFPAVNHANDAIQTFIRPAAGAIVFAASAGVVTDVHPILALSLGLLMSGGVHTVKSVAVRPAVTATTAGAGNVPVSILEDVVAAITSILAIVVPVLFAMLLILFTTWVVWLLLRRADRMRPAA